MERLPDLALMRILQFCSLKQRIRLSLVCKQWRQLILNLNRETLFCHFDVFPRDLRWSYTNRTVGLCNSFRIRSLDFLQAELTRRYFGGLKKLLIFNVDFGLKGVHNFAGYLNHFERLQQLELNGFNLKNDTTIRLPNLELLTLKDVSINNSNFRIFLDTPALQVLVCWKKIANVRFLDCPRRLRYLECVNDLPNFKFGFQFPHLEQLNLFDVTGSLRQDFLQDFPAIRTLVLFNNFSQEDLQRLRSREEVVSRNVKVLFLAFDEVYVKPTIGFNFTNMLQRRNIESLVGNYSKLNETVTWPTYLDFSELLLQFNHTIPASFLTKFVNINTLHVAKLVDHSPLIEFLRACGHLHYLRVTYSLLPQTFFDRLPDSSISILEITEEETGNIQNFKFIAELQIFQLKIRFNVLPVDLVANRLANGELKYFNFKKESFNLSISLREDRAFYLNVDHRAESKFTKADDVMSGLRKDRKIRDLLIE